MTKKQEVLVQEFLSCLCEDEQPIYNELVSALAELGYSSKKQKSDLSFTHSLHNKQIAKMGFRTGKSPRPFFALRFSGCQVYSARFQDVVKENITKYPSKFSRCIDGNCDYCGGPPATHVYFHDFPDGEKNHCGAYALEITGISESDLEEIKRLLTEENQYLMVHQVG